MGEQHTDAWAQNRRLGRGVNIIGYDPLWRSRAEGRMQDRHFRLIREAGFDHVRINLHPFRFMGDEPDYTIAPAWLETLDWAIDRSLKNELIVILDLHEFIAMGQDPLGLKPRFLAAWRQLAARYRNTPQTVYWELLNEPNGALTSAMWNQMLHEPYDIVRQASPERTLIIGPGFWNGIEHLAELALPVADHNIIATVHYYHPMAFTHQGAAWTPEYADRVGIEWLGTPEEQQFIVDELSAVQAWSEREKRPILLGEFGAYERADMASRERYIRFLVRHVERLGWSWSYWQFDADFVVYDIPNDRWVAPLRDALIPPQRA